MTITCKVTCDGIHGCQRPIAHIDRKGYVYCATHGRSLTLGGRPMRKLRPSEIKRLEKAQAIKY